MDLPPRLYQTMKSKMAARAAARDTKVTSANSSYVEFAADLLQRHLRGATLRHPLQL